MKKFGQKCLIWIFVKILAPKIKVKYDEDFYFNFRDKVLGWRDYFCEPDMLFARHLKEYHGLEIPWRIGEQFTISLLHEIGHYKTIGDLFFEDIMEEETERILLQMCSGIDYEIAKRYCNLPTEFAATEWAVNFWREHKNFINFWTKMFNNFLVIQNS